jgi:hypothetical protein
MQVVLYILSVIAFFYAAIVTVIAKSAIHEILAGVGWVVFAVFLAGAAIVSVLDRIAKLGAVKPAFQNTLPRADSTA